MSSAHRLHDHVCVYVRMLAMLGMAGAAVASAAGLMTTVCEYPCYLCHPVYCLFVIRFPLSCLHACAILRLYALLGY